jgi:adenylyltransferase/sulfurtransferase
MPKAAAAARALAGINSRVRVEPFICDLSADNIDDALRGAAVILDGTDNFETRYLINDYCVRQGLPWIYGAAVGSYGLVMPVIPGRTACLRCVYPEPPSGAQPTCETAGVLNVVTAAVASLQVAEALKILSGHPELVLDRITTLDLWNGGIRQIPAPERDSHCVSCERREFPALRDSARPPVRLCGRNAVQVHQSRRSLNLSELRVRLEPLGEVRANDYALRFLVDTYEMTVFPDGRAIVKGTSDTGVARSLYARYIG